METYTRQETIKTKDGVWAKVNGEWQYYATHADWLDEPDAKVNHDLVSDWEQSLADLSDDQAGTFQEWADLATHG